MKKIILLINTIRYLKAEQILYRLIYKFKPCTKLGDRTDVQTSNFRHTLIESETNESTYVGNGKFKFLNEEGLGTDWCDCSKSKLWLYNLNYFDDFNSISSTERKALHIELMLSWIKHNPVGALNSWEAYPISLRIVNWIKWLDKNRDFTDTRVTNSLYIQTSFLSKNIEYHILGNHLFCNAKALIFSGVFFGGDEAKKWLDLGIKLIDRELEEQVLNDGGNFELSPMYHNIFVKDLLDLINLSVATENTELLRRVKKWVEVAGSMLTWAQKLTHPDGEIGFFNDSAFGIAPKISKLIDYAARLDIKPFDLSIGSNVSTDYFKDSGYIALRSCNFFAILDVAKIGPDYLPGHAHADSLSFELSIFGHRVFVNSGTSQYGISDERLRQRKTAAHNTVEVDGCDSSQVWSGFRVAKRAYPSTPLVISQHGSVNVKCTHNGYKRLPGKVTHKRKWDMRKGEICIEDELLGSYKEAFAHYHIHPDITIKHADEDRGLVLTLPDERFVYVKATSKIKIESTTWHPEFGKVLPNKKLLLPIVDNKLKVTIRF
ncbi:heparinase II/III family protein [Vibrio breoganii]|uniref:heparinase II/III family protein n=1 Tax=Vibrio breoganii TaxID=553239 RepID=UPI000304BC3F|nr:alginate lyase family protein [Vibrio breoganii]OED98586.1 heparinase [Vibrio breoganii ZF-55]